MGTYRPKVIYQKIKPKNEVEKVAQERRLEAAYAILLDAILTLDKESSKSD